MHSLAALLPKLRADPTSFGLLSANGGVLTKHAVGIYSCQKPAAASLAGWSREDPAATQARVEALPSAAVATELDLAGEIGVVESYTVLYAGAAAASIVVIGTVTAGSNTGRRFIGKIEPSPAALKAATTDDLLGRSGTIGPDPTASNDQAGRTNLFMLAAGPAATARL